MIKIDPFTSMPLGSVPSVLHPAIPADASNLPKEHLRHVLQDPDWVHEPLLTGLRAICSVDHSVATIVSIDGREHTRELDNLRRALLAQGLESAVLDGVITTHEDQNAEPELRCFDLLFLDGNDLRDLPLVQRKRILKGILNPEIPSVSYCAHISGKGLVVFSSARRFELTGIVSKQKESPYPDGSTSNWVVFPCQLAEEPQPLRNLLKNK